jgi:cytochrome c oxidase cbb3-type subunit III
LTGGEKALLCRIVLSLLLATWVGTAVQLAAQTPPAAAPVASPDQPKPVAKPDAASIERGQKTFITNCGFCHGSRAKGGEKGPDLLRSVLVLDDENGQSIGRVILKGRPDKGMPKFAMTPEQITDIANFLHDGIKSAANRDDYKILNIVTGDPKAGEAYFNGAGKCSSCHSVTGDLKGIGVKYDPVTLQDKILMPRDRWGGTPSPKSTVTVTVTLPTGEAITGPLLGINDFLVALRDENGYRAFTRKDENNPAVQIHDPMKVHTDMLKTYTDENIHNLTAYLVTVK